MKQAGEPINNLIGKDKSVSLYIFKHVLFQILFSLCKAQELCEFIHNDLHLKNILIDLPERTAITKYHEYKNETDIWYIDSKIVVTIVDFGLSRITLDDGTIIHNNVHSEFLPNVDTERLAAEFSKFKISSWSNDFSNDSFSSEDEKEEKKQKRNLLQKMRKGERISKLLKHPFFNCLMEKPKKPLDLIIDSTVSPPSTPKPTEIFTPKSVISKRTNSLTLSPMSSMLASQNNSPALKTCLPKISVCISEFADSIAAIQQKAFSKTKPISSLVAAKENVKNKIGSVLTKRKFRKNSAPEAKRRKLK